MTNEQIIEDDEINLLDYWRVLAKKKNILNKKRRLLWV